jgi:hypothetical protein
MCVCVNLNLKKKNYFYHLARRPTRKPLSTATLLQDSYTSTIDMPSPEVVPPATGRIYRWPLRSTCIEIHSCNFCLYLVKAYFNDIRLFDFQLF